jgi:hypothetical protein
VKGEDLHRTKQRLDPQPRDALAAVRRKRSADRLEVAAEFVGTGIRRRRGHGAPGVQRQFESRGRRNQARVDAGQCEPVRLIGALARGIRAGVRQRIEFATDGCQQLRHRQLRAQRVHGRGVVVEHRRSV